MNTSDITELLRIRRELTGENFNNGTVQAWTEAFKQRTTDQVRLALVAASLTHQRVTVAHIVEHLPTPAGPGPRRDTHSLACICNGRGWIETEHHRQHQIYMAWARCPNGPPTDFIVLEDNYDPEAGAAAHATFAALSATAETKAEIANACFAAAAAYRNTIDPRAR
jgi:hypothetical protein